MCRQFRELRSMVLFLSNNEYIYWPFPSEGLPTSWTLAKLVGPLLTLPSIKDELSSNDLVDYQLFDWLPTELEPTVKIRDIQFPGMVIAVPRSGEGTALDRAAQVKLRASSEERADIKAIVTTQIENDRKWVNDHHPPEIVEIRPGIWGVSVNLKALARLARSWLKK